MILQNTIGIILLCLIWVEAITGAAFSNVFVQRNPVEYVKYGTPNVALAGQQLAQISSAPVETVVPLPSVSNVVSPCVAPCVISSASIPSTRANIITYKSPIADVPVVLAEKDNSPGYQYSYVVYDEHTGDQKSQSEQSDGSVVQGHYSLIEPNGSRREVVYTADDLKGFNAVVRNILPEPKTTNSKELPKDEEKQSLPPCDDVKSEQLKELPKKEQKEMENLSDSNSHEESVEGLKQSPVEITTFSDKPASEAEKLEPTTAEPKSETTIPALPENNSVVSYNDIIKCLQTKLRDANSDTRTQVQPSPLTYILLSSLGSYKPC